MGGVAWLWINSYSSLCIVFLGSIMSWLFSINVVYGCGVRICRSGGLLRLASLIISVLVHILLKWWMCGWASILLHVFIEGLIVMIKAYNM